jgi:hypothetical protein
MNRKSPEAIVGSPDWLVRPFESSKLAPAWLGLGVMIAFSMFMWLIHVLAVATVGPLELPFGPARYAGSVLVNGALLGLILTGHAQLNLSAVSDLQQLRPMISGSDEDFARLKQEFPNPSLSVRWLTTAGGGLGGLAVASLDPTLQQLYDHVAPTDPRYLAYLVQNMLFGGLGTRLFAAEIHLTRAYARLGERVEVDLLDLSKVLIFARKGLRSVVIWVLISSAFSMFWVLDSAGQANTWFPFAVLILVIVALVAPTLGIHRSIRAAKEKELALLSEAIRTERAVALAPRRADARPEDARLGNLIQYQSFIKSLREWPFDLSIVSRSLLLLVLGAGSWLGGAIVERLLNVLLD